MLTDSLFFESVDAYCHDVAWQDLIARLLGDSWVVRRKAFWLQCSPPAGTGAALVEQGFKIHVAADVANADEQLAKALPVLSRHAVHFKVVADARLLTISNSKNFPRTASGKFITAYPGDTASFLALAEELSTALAGFKGPHLLTDKPLPGSSCVFYRYGAFTDMKTIGRAGAIAPALRDGGGTLIEDERTTEFIMPNWIIDPYPDEEEEADSGDEPLLEGRFAVTQALQFSNGGGVYLANDLRSGDTVVIKEARPLTCVRKVAQGFSDAQTALRSEFRVSQALGALAVTPQPLAFFSDSGHLFFAQEYLDYPDWLAFFARDEVCLLPFVRGGRDTSVFLDNFLPVMRSAIDGLMAVHDAGIVLGDISNTNILVDPVTKSVKFIDLESAVELGKLSASRRHMATPGFVPPHLGAGSPIQPADDWYALGKCGLAAILPVQALSSVCSISDQALVETMVWQAGLPSGIANMLLALLAGDPSAARISLEALSTDSSAASMAAKPDAVSDVPGLETVSARVARFIAAHYNGPAATMVWPCSPESSQASRWSIAYGVAGIAHFLEQAQVPLPDDLARAVRKRGAFSDVADTGLFTGQSGVAYWLASRGQLDQAIELLRAAQRSPLRSPDLGVFSGQAGLGIAALSIHHLSNDGCAMEVASECAVQLADRAIISDSGHPIWPSRHADGRTYWGFSFGQCGIAFFLAQYAVACGDRGLAKLARQSLELLLDGIRTSTSGRPYIGLHDGSSGSAAYWANGAAGISSVLLRVGMQTDDACLVEAAKGLATGAFTRYGVIAGQLDGTAGILECISDCVALTGDSRFRGFQRQMREGLMLHQCVDADGGIGFPGSNNLRLSCDFGTGAAGIALALDRRMTAPREFFDFHLPSRALFGTRSTPANGAPDIARTMHRTIKGIDDEEDAEAAVHGGSR